jgi:hypothetical protein
VKAKRREITLDEVKEKNTKLFEVLTEYTINKMTYDDEDKTLWVYPDITGFLRQDLEELLNVGLRFINTINYFQLGFRL